MKLQVSKHSALKVRVSRWPFSPRGWRGQQDVVNTMCPNCHLLSTRAPSHLPDTRALHLCNGTRTAGTVLCPSTPACPPPGLLSPEAPCKGPGLVAVRGGEPREGCAWMWGRLEPPPSLPVCPRPRREAHIVDTHDDSRGGAAPADLLHGDAGEPLDPGINPSFLMELIYYVAGGVLMLTCTG